MKTLSLFLIFSAASSFAHSELQKKSAAEFGPGPSSLCQISLLLNSGQVRPVPSRFLTEAECFWMAETKLKESAAFARKAFVSHGDLKKEIELNN